MKVWTPQRLARVLRDTGECARELLGYNYDEDDNARRINVGTGGIRKDGKTQEIVELLDDLQLKYKLILAPRGCRKSTIAQTYVIRKILLNPNIRFAYVGKTDDIVREKALAIRTQLLLPDIIEQFGPQKGDKWEEDVFTVAARTEGGLQNATLKCFSLESFPTGGRFDEIILDDLIDQDNVATPQQNDKSKARWAQLQPMLAPGGKITVFGTLWADDDIYHDLMQSPLFQAPLGGQIVCGAGVEVIKTEEGKLDLELADGGLTFPHLTLPHLREKLLGMAAQGNAHLFTLQYLNQTTPPGGGIFRREFFKPLNWDRDMEKLTGYVVTDTAISEEAEACYSVVGYMALDASDNIYLLDLRVGNFSPHDFVTQFFDVLETWIDRVNHAGECWEKVSLSLSYRAAVEGDARARKIRLRPIEMARPSSSHKNTRINRLQPPMMNGRFYVVNTVPRMFTDVTGEKELWNPVGFWNPDKKAFQPSGELVDEFVRGHKSKKDIPDALAMIHEYEKVRKSYRRYCTYKPWAPKRVPVLRHLTQEHYDTYDPRSVTHDRTSDSGGGGGDWWETTLRDHGL